MKTKTMACYTDAKAKPIKTKPAKGWSKERRAAQAARCKAQQPWRHSTGPKTARGKALSARNATRHGYRSKAWLAEVARCRKLFRLLKIYMRVLRSCAHKGFSPVPYICVLRRNLPSTSAVNHENISTHGD